MGYSKRFDYEIPEIYDQLTLRQIKPGEKMIVCEADLEDVGVKLWEENGCYSYSEALIAADELENMQRLSRNRRKRIANVVRELVYEADNHNQTIEL